MRKHIQINHLFVAISLLLLTLILLGCSSQKRRPDSTAVPESYSFFVAGHVYGTPGVDVPGFYAPFRENLMNVMKGPNPVDFGVLTGDVVWLGTKQDWDELDEDINALEIPVHISLGNHDKATEVYKTRQEKPYYSFDRGNDLFIILNVDKSDWSVRGDQLIFLKGLLASKSKYEKHIYFYAPVGLVGTG